MTCIKERVVWDYYYIEIVKCYLCLALNHQLGSHRYHAEIWKLWGACDVCECERRINAFVVQTIGHYFRACSYSLCQVQRLNSENGDLSTRRGNQMLRKGGSPHKLDVSFFWCLFPSCTVHIEFFAVFSNYLHFATFVCLLKRQRQRLKQEWQKSPARTRKTCGKN